jgi:hypothetical protein
MNIEVPTPGEVYVDRKDRDRTLLVEAVDLASPLGRNVVGKVTYGAAPARDYAADMNTFRIVWERR